MISRFLEILILFLFNGLRRALARRKPRRLPAASPDESACVIGQELRPDAESGAYRTPEPVWVRLTLSMLKAHCYILGATGTGKSTLLMKIIENYLTSRTGFVCIDLRGDLTEKILRLIASRLSAAEIASGRVLLIDMDADERVVGFNPLLGEGDVHQRAGALHRVLKAHSDSWGVQLDETIRAALVALAERAQEGYSLLDMEPLLTHAAFRREFLERVKDPYARSFFERFEELSPEQQRMFASAVLNKAAPFLANPALRNMLGTPPTFSLNELLDERPGQIILISLAVHRFHEAAFTLGEFFVSALQDVFSARIRQPEDRRLPVGIVIDEFENFGSDRFAEIIAENRKLNAHLVLAHQNLSQLDNRLRLCLLENCRAQFYFQCGAHDAEILSRSLYLDEPRDAVQATLRQQKVGECYFTLRGDATRRIRIHRSEEPEATEDAVQAAREASWKHYARPRADVERLLAEHTAAIRRSGATTAKPGNPAAHPSRRKPGRDARPAEPPTEEDDKRPAIEPFEVRDHDEENATPAKRSRRKPKSPPS